MRWECFCVVGFDLGPLLQGRMRILHLQYFFIYVLTYFLQLNSYLSPERSLMVMKLKVKTYKSPKRLFIIYKGDQVSTVQCVLKHVYLAIYITRNST